MSMAFSQITLTSTVSNVSCNGGANGSATVSATGGTGAYTYTWAPTNTHFDVISGLSAGSYTVYVEDAVANISSLVVIIGEPAFLTAMGSTTNSSCGQANGQTCAYVTGGTVPLNFLWSNGVTTLCNSNVVAGAYSFTVTDMNNCIAIVSGIVNNTLGPVVSVSSQTNVTCFGLCNGAANISVAGGASPYVYNWSNGQVGATGFGMCAGPYTVSVTDNAGCIGTTTINIAQPAQLNTSINANNVKCFGTATGTIAAITFGGTPPYNYLWTGGSTLAIVPNIVAGNYQVNVTDVNGCTSTNNYNITQPTQLNAIVSSTNASCFGACNGSANVIASGGVGAYFYTLNGWANSSFANNLCPGMIQSTITDANGCTLTRTVVITQPPQITLNIGSTNASCNSICNATATISISGGIPSYTIMSQPSGLHLGVSTNLCAGDYTLIAQDSNGCIQTPTLSILPYGGSLPNATITLTSYNEICYQSGDGSIDLNISGINPGPFVYTWSNGATTEDVLNLYSGYYLVTVYDASLNCMTIGGNISANGTNCGSISGNVFVDNNSNCIKNGGDNNLYNIQVVANPGNRLGYSNFNGDYFFSNLPFGTYSVTANTNTVNMQTTCGTNILSVTLNSTTPNSNNNNFVRENIPPTQPDMYVSAWSQGIVPGFVCRVNYLVYNSNTYNANGVFKATLPTAFVPNITNANPAVYTLSGDTIIWNFNNINYSGWTPNFYVDFTTPSTTPLGSVFTTCMYAQPNMADFDPANNNYCYSHSVTGSFDPNDKTVSPAGIGPNGDIAATETDLRYLIRFQNTGNGPAVNIVVKDTLSPNVDINTFEMLGSSHNYNIDVLNGNVLRWKFNNIMLQDSNSNEPGSHGYIHYRIKRTANNTPGTQIKNTAYIYFDFNEPVVTNTAINTIETITGIRYQNNADDHWIVYPNPSTGILNLINNSISPETKLHIQIVNSFGQLIHEESINANYKTVDLTKLSNGVYFMKLVSDKQSSVKRIVLSK
ncbi:MAG: hypothetical protein K0S26_2744 [Bacteroidota bacterium]|nr:hypothetical protein [Bacteroidota bacterium]